MGRKAKPGGTRGLGVLPTDSVVVITGASAGIGRVYAERFAARGHPLLLIARDTQRLEALAAELLAKHGTSARVLSADLSRDDDIERVARALAGEPNLGVLVHNAGFGTKGPIHKTDVDAQTRMVHVHVVATSRLCAAVLPGMVARERGWVIIVSSIASFVYGPSNANYCATKGYQRMFAEALDTEVRMKGVYVQALCPGFTHTEFHARMEMDKSTVPDFLWGDAGRVVDESIAAAERGRPRVVVPRFRNRILTLLARLSPHWVRRRGRPGQPGE
jgi:short-subunit dehydrogenase